MGVSQRAIDELLRAALVETLRRNQGRKLEGGAGTYGAQGALTQIAEAKEPEVLVDGPAGTGKSRAILEMKINRPLWEYPGARALIVRKTRSSLNEAALYTYEHFVMGDDNPIVAGANRDSRVTYDYPNGSQVVVGGMSEINRKDSSSKAVMSTEYDIIYVQEAIELSQDDWEALNSRARNGRVPYQQLIGDTNPDKPTHWLKRRCDAGLVRRIASKHEDNPVLWDAVRREWTERGKAYLARLDALTGARKKRLRYGEWVQAEGAVYEAFDYQTHVIDSFPIPQDWRKIIVLDFGFTNPFVCQWWAVDPDDRLYLYREMYMTQRIVEDHVKEILSLTGEERIEQRIADHDAEDRATAERHGFATVPARKNVVDGIQRVQARLKIAGDGKPRLFFFRDALVEKDQKLAEAGKPTSTIDEITGYTWAKAADGRPQKEVPLKLDDHGMDALRYGVMAVDDRMPYVVFVPNRAPTEEEYARWMKSEGSHGHVI